jgi:predicted  nucleic acid-binding Zn-ribbon protein
LEDELEALSEFKQNRNSYMAELDNYKTLLEDTKKRYKEKLERLEFRFYEEKSKLQREFASKLKENKAISYEVLQMAPACGSSSSSV